MGSTEWRSGEFLTDSCGSLQYAAPELIAEEECLYEGPGVDVWALGVILYALLCNTMPFDGHDFSQTCNRIKRGTYSMPAFVSKEAQSLIRRLLVVNPSKRASIPEIRNHPWFQKDLPEALVEKKTLPPLPNLLQPNGSFTAAEEAEGNVAVADKVKGMLPLPRRKHRACDAQAVRRHQSQLQRHVSLEHC